MLTNGSLQGVTILKDKILEDNTGVASHLDGKHLRGEDEGHKMRPGIEKHLEDDEPSDRHPQWEMQAISGQEHPQPGGAGDKPAREHAYVIELPQQRQSEYESRQDEEVDDRGHLHGVHHPLDARRVAALYPQGHHQHRQEHPETIDPQPLAGPGDSGKDDPAQVLPPEHVEI